MTKKTIQKLDILVISDVLLTIKPTFLVWYSDHHLKNRPFVNYTSFQHLNTEQVQNLNTRQVRNLKAYCINLTI